MVSYDNVLVRYAVLLFCLLCFHCANNPDTGSGILTKIGIYNDGDFVGYTSFLDFSDDFTVTVNGNKIEVTLAGGGGGAGTLQETTDLGNTTTNDIQLIDAAEVIFGAGGGVLLDNASRDN